jgi:hypothetical protein
MITGHALNTRKKENHQKNYFFFLFFTFFYSIYLPLYILKSNNCYEGKKKIERILRYLADVCSSPSEQQQQ